MSASVYDEYIAPFAGDNKINFVTGYTFTDGFLSVAFETADGTDTATFELEEDISNVEVSCYPGDKRMILNILTTADELFIAIITRDRAADLFQCLTAIRKNGALIMNLAWTDA